MPPLAALRTFAGTPQETLRNYGMGHSVVSYMLDAYGTAQMASLFQNIRELRNTEKALTATYGLTIHELDNEWRRSVGLAERAEITLAPPPLQVIPTRRPTATPANAAGISSASPSPAAPTDPASSAPTDTPAPTYTPQPTPAVAPAGGCSAPMPPSGVDAANPLELASAALLAGPIALLTLVAWRRRRPN